MKKNLRTHGKSTIVWLLLGMLVLGLGGFGISNFGGGETAIGAVGKTEITARDYARALRSELNSYSQQAGTQITMAQAQSAGLQQAVQGQLFVAAALAEEARRIGLSVGDEQVARTISEAPAFKGLSGAFDNAAYQEVLRREGLSTTEFERDIRRDEARAILQRAVVSGVRAPAPMVDATAKWLLQTRDFSWREVTADQLPQPIADPGEAALQAWHQANAARFTAPETRRITYAWLTPEMLQDEVQLDEAALRALYDQRRDEFHQPERRMVSRLVYPDLAGAEAARARLDRGEVDFAGLVAERGLTLDDVDLGEMTQAQLGAAGDAVFALAGPGIAGPVQTDLGPALFSMNAILDPVDVPFETAQADLRAEAAADRARRTIEERSGEFEDMLASGSSLEDLARDTPMDLGQIDWSAQTQAEPGSIAAYQAFRDHAARVEAGDFPELFQLEDGGVFALRLDEVVPPALKPFASVRDEVLSDWRSSETHRQLLELADEEKLVTVAAKGAGAAPAEGGTSGMGGMSGMAAPATPAVSPAAPSVAHQERGMARDGWIDGAPPDLVARAFAIAEPGDAEVVDAQGRVFVVQLDAVHDADLAAEAGSGLRARVGQQLGQSLQADIFDYFARAVQRKAGVHVNDGVVSAVNAQVQ